jgi:hypothetical protein
MHLNLCLYIIEFVNLGSPIDIMLLSLHFYYLLSYVRIFIMLANICYKKL